MADLEAKGFIHRQIGGQHALVPADFHAEAWLMAIPLDKELLITGRRPRSPAHHRTFFAALNLIVENSDDWRDEDELLDAIKLGVGHVRRQMRLDGSIQLVPRSIDFASMDEEAFKRFVRRAEYVLAVVGIDLPRAMSEIADRKQKRRAA